MSRPRDWLGQMARRAWPAPVTPGARERARVAALGRYTPFATRLIGPEVRAPDAGSFLPMVDEIHGRGLYTFTAATDAPRILDAGANIGLSVLFFKALYPKARLTAFEADPAIFDYLARNVRSAGIADAELLNVAVWDAPTTLTFDREGADAGRVAGVGVALGDRQVAVPAVRLRDYLTEPIDLLKIDIEGAEMRVLADAADRLGMVERLFVEYHSFATRPQELDELFRLLRTAGMRVWAEAVIPKAHPFCDRRELFGMDLQMNVFADRVAR